MTTDPDQARDSGEVSNSAPGPGEGPSQPPTSQGPVYSPQPPAGAGVMSEAQIGDGKLWAILGYALNFIGVPFCAVPLFMKNNEFALYHGKQALGIWLAGLGLTIVGVVVFFVLFMVFPPLACVAQVALLVVGLGMMILNILGLVNTLGNKCVPVPVIGPIAESVFSGVRVKAM